MIVDAGATSQPKRSDGGSAASAPPAGSPQTTARIASRLVAHRGGVEVRRERREAPLVDLRAQVEEVALAAVDDDADVDLLAAVDARDDAQDRVGERRVSRGHARSPSGTCGGARGAA